GIVGQEHQLGLLLVDPLQHALAPLIALGVLDTVQQQRQIRGMAGALGVGVQPDLPRLGEFRQRRVPGGGVGVAEQEHQRRVRVVPDLAAAGIGAVLVAVTAVGVDDGGVGVRVFARGGEVVWQDVG